MNAQTLEALEYGALTALLAERTQTPLGRTLALSLHPSTDANEIKKGLKLTSDCARYFRQHASFGLGGLTDPGDMLRLLKIENSRLVPAQILAIINLIEAGQDLRASLLGLRDEYPYLSILTGELPDLRHLLRSIRGKILPTGELDDHASPELAEIRHQIQRARTRIYGRLETIMRRSPEGLIQDEIVTIRSERFVIPIRATHRGQFPGVVHAVSSSGATVFVEPLEAIEMNNELVRLAELEQVEISRILLDLSDRLRVELAQLEKLTHLIAEIDLIAAKAKLALDFNCTEPKVEENGYRLSLRNARHLILENILKQRGENTVPISVELDDENTTLIISGPNAGGKTVALKTIGLAALMAQSGMHVPASDANLSVFNQVLADIGDRQSIVANLSTFTAHIINVKEMAETLSRPALVLIDEAGVGTDPEEGAALAVAMVDFFKRRGAMTVAATHYHALKAYGSLTRGVINASVEFDGVKLQPTYRLIQGIPGASNGIEIANRVGLPGEIIADAKKQLSPSGQEATDYLRRLKTELDLQEDVRQALDEERAALAERFERLEREFNQREILRRERFESELKRLIEHLSNRATELIREISDHKTQLELRKFADRRIAKLKMELREESSRVKFEIPAPAPAVGSVPAEETELNVGDRVRMRDIDKTGIVADISDDQVSVQVGTVRFKTGLRNLDVIVESSKKAPKDGATVARGEEGVVVELRPRKEIGTELYLRGKTIEEAIELTDQFLDEAYLASVDTVRIVHGTGTGALRKAIREMLEGHPHVASFRPGRQSEGAGGVTIVELRKR